MQPTENAMQLRRAEVCSHTPGVLECRGLFCLHVGTRPSTSTTGKLKRLAEAAQTIRVEDDAESVATSEFTATLRSTTDAIIQTFADWGGDLSKSCQF